MLVEVFFALTLAAAPNVVLFYADDLGYGDLGCYGGSAPTPAIDRLASEGRRFTDFYVAQAVCSASRSALLTGCYPNRINIFGALSPRNPVGIADDEMTIAEVLKTRGYHTAIFGKWHLGDAPTFLPPRHGFDEYAGLPYSNDMKPAAGLKANYPELPYIEQQRVAQRDPDQTQLTAWATKRALAFIEKNKPGPFFLYMPYSMPHVPLHVSKEFQGKSGKGLYADVLAEIDASVGAIVSKIASLGLDDQTLILFSSDNGPWLVFGNHGGSAGPLREGKGTSFDGGVRVPLIARWKGKVPAGTVCSVPWMTIDILPTLAGLAGAALPTREIDGNDARSLLFDREPTAPHQALYFYWGKELQAVRSGRWKLHFPHDYRVVLAPPAAPALPGKQGSRTIGRSLFDLEKDIGESKNVADQHPDVVATLTAYADGMRQQLGDALTKTPARSARKSGWVGSSPAP